VARLKHRNVVTVYTADEADGLLYLAMEYVAGEDLAALLERERRLDALRVVALLTPVADALDTAHAAQLVHRDVKPSNLLVTAPGTSTESVTLLDFGISRILDDDSEITRTGEIVGTIAYCSPEQLSHQPVGGACDQYSLACVAYECLTGEIPFPREGQLALMAAHLTAPPPRATARRPDVPSDVDGVLARAMAKDPAARYPTCTAFVTALLEAVTGTGSRAHPEFPDPPALAHGTATRPAAHPDFLGLRVGWRSTPEPGPLVARLTATGPLAVRADPGAAAGLVRWLLAQAVARHALRDLCLVGVLAPVPDENWLWVGWLPHARPSTPPLAGPHVATTPDAAADLSGRLGALAGARDAPFPRVLAVLDSRLVTVDLAALERVGRVGIHVIALLPPGTPTPYGMSTLDVEGDRCRLSQAGQPLLTGQLETVSTAYVRALSEDLPDA
jgi:serine/threonine-protein kinase